MHAQNEQMAMIKDVVYKIDVETLDRSSEDKSLTMNDIGRVKIRASRRLMIDPYRKNRNTGSIVLVDQATKKTVAAGMIV